MLLKYQVCVEKTNLALSYVIVGWLQVIETLKIDECAGLLGVCLVSNQAIHLYRYLLTCIGKPCKLMIV
jgi:hypothetical protein